MGRVDQWYKDTAWLAGFVDAEGTFGVIRRQRQFAGGMLNVRYRPAIQVGNTHPETWPVAARILEQRGLECNEYIRQRQSVSWSIEARGAQRCARWIEVLLPYLRVKKADALLLREFCDFVMAHPNRGAAGSAYGARERDILRLFGVDEAMGVRPSKGSRSPTLAAQPVLFNPAALGEADLAWLGGFFDGEGSIMWVQHAGYWLASAALNNTHLPVLPYVRAIMDAHGLAYFCQPHAISPQEGKLPFWRIMAAGVPRTEAWLTLLLPYLQTKREQAEEMLEYCRQNPALNNPVSPADKDRMREMYATGDYRQQDLAALFGIARGTVNRILSQDKPAGIVYHGLWRRKHAHLEDEET